MLTRLTVLPPDNESQAGYPQHGQYPSRGFRHLHALRADRERTEDDNVHGAMIAAAREALAVAQLAYIELVERIAADDLPEDFPGERVDAMLHAAGKSCEDLVRDVDRIAKSLAITEVSRLASPHLIDRAFNNARREAMR